VNPPLLAGAAADDRLRIGDHRRSLASFAGLGNRMKPKLVGPLLSKHRIFEFLQGWDFDASRDLFESSSKH
jgi:hypothetical protein